MKHCPCCKKERRCRNQLLCSTCWRHVPPFVRREHLKTLRKFGPGSRQVMSSARYIVQNLRHSETIA